MEKQTGTGMARYRNNEKERKERPSRLVSLATELFDRWMPRGTAK